ncbi:hypothetical protein [Geopseudomonas aromaticivorans]
MGRPRRIVPRVRVSLNLDPLVEIDRLALAYVQAYARENLLPLGESSTLRAGIEMLVREAVLARVQKERTAASRLASPVPPEPSALEVQLEVGAVAPAPVATPAVEQPSAPPAPQQVEAPRVVTPTISPSIRATQVEQPHTEAPPAVVVTRREPPSAATPDPVFDFDTAGLSMPSVDEGMDSSLLPEPLNTSWADDLQSMDVPPPVGLGTRSSVILGFGVKAKT